MTATLLPIPDDDPRIASLLADWPEPFQTDAISAGHYFPRSLWLRSFEDVLREWHPSANSDSLTHVVPGFALPARPQLGSAL